MIVFRTPKGWTGPAYIDGKKTTGSWRAHQVPLANARDTPEHLAGARGLARELPARGAVRRRRPGARDDIRALAPAGQPADERQPARQRRPAAAGPAPARLPRVRGRRPDARRLDLARRRASSAGGSPTSSGSTRTTSGSSARTRRRPTGCRPSSTRPTSSGTPSSTARRSTSTWPARAASWRCSPSTRCRAGSRATCSPDGTACSTATRRSSTSSTRWSTSTPSG